MTFSAAALPLDNWSDEYNMQAMIKRVSTADAVVQHFTEEIRSGKLKAGDSLPSERVLQDQLGISRFSLREGLAKLQALGLIQIRHGKGATVSAEPSLDALNSVLLPMMNGEQAIEDLVEARALVEGELAALACQRATEEDLALLEGMLSAPVVDDDDAVAELDYRFHRETARIAGNAFMSIMYEAIAPHVRSFLSKYLRAHRNHQDVIDRHRPLLNAIREGDPMRARMEARAHINLCANSIRNDAP